MLKRGATGFPPHQSWLQRVCPGSRLILALLGVITLMGLLTVIFGVLGRRAGSDLKRMEVVLQKVNGSISTELKALQQKETDDLKTLAKLDQMVKRLTDEMDKVKSDVKGKVAGLRNTLKAVNCNLQDIKNNRTVGNAPCCLAGWESFSRSCYWVSKQEKSWEEAKADCEDKDAHLVTITSYVEQQFVALRTKPRYTWIGLFYASGNWKWVDGTTYTVRRIDWKPGHPYTFGRDTNERTRCAYLHRDGLWSEGHSSQRYSWVCEMNLTG
ncbi:asialoglycoprotein receptor 1-like [Heteronotia binoei]|uniref:asialoglycoprotein receptor 1-like n=1 Tax=Heteronotia binoei TaxID=13085 RepID=UPI00292D9197|nr:asialoglycoprotein receptor 1-like [Heteronotia binoei]